MKLSKLIINSDFGSFKSGFRLNFLEHWSEEYISEVYLNQFNPYCFAGLNGSGKSNVLEALANIFFHLESCANVNQPMSFLNNFDPLISYPNAYQLEYYIVPKTSSEYLEKNVVRVLVNKNENEPPKMLIIPYPFSNENLLQEIPTIANKTTKQQSGSKLYLPDLIIGYSSGENEVLSVPFLKTRLIHFDEYIQAIEEKTEYKQPESNLIYIDYEMSQAVLLSNYIFHNKKVLEPLTRELGILDIKRFRINLNLHQIEKDKKSFKILEQYKDKIDAFKRCSTSFYEDERKLILDFWINKATKNSFKENFKNIFDLFQTFHILYTLNYRIVNQNIKSDIYQSKGYYTEEKIPTPAPNDKVFFFLDYFIEKRIEPEGTTIQLLMKNLSDGEQQFLHSLSICLMLKGKSTLLLLDEPETHFNPDWRSKFISILKDSLEKVDSNNLMREIIITTHSPFIISDCLPNKVIIFRNGKPPINARDISFRTFGTSIDIIMEHLFKKNNTIGDLSNREIKLIHKDIENKKSLTEEQVKEYKNKINHLGDSMEKILLFAQLNELKKK